MEQEKPDEQPDVSPEKLWDQLSDEQRTRVLGLLTEVALKYVLAQMGKGKGDTTNGTCEPVEDTQT